MKNIALMIGLALGGCTAASVESYRPMAATYKTSVEPITLEALVNTNPDNIWNALTTSEGARTFFASEANIDPRIGGAYEIYFLPNNPQGLKGSEGVKILAMEPASRLLFSWNAPPQFGPLRQQQTVVEIALQPQGPQRTRVTLTHWGWGHGPKWEAMRACFEGNWQVVLGRLQYRFDKGPVNWTSPPDGIEYFRASADPHYRPTEHAGRTCSVVKAG